MKKIKLFEQYIREFVEDSTLTYKSLNNAYKNIEKIISSIKEDFVDEMEVEDGFEEFLSFSLFRELNTYIQKYFDNNDSNFHDNLEKTLHLIKEMIEQYNMEDVRYDSLPVNDNIDEFINNINNVSPYIMNKLGVRV